MRPLTFANMPTRWVTVLAASLNTGGVSSVPPFTGRLRLGLGGSVLIKYDENGNPWSAYGGDFGVRRTIASSV